MANITYDNRSTRRVYLTKGLISVLPGISIFWFILSVINIGAPPSINLLSEIMLLSSILNSSFILSILIGFSRFLAGAYSLYIYVSVQHGQFVIHINSFTVGNFRIINSLLFHILPSIFLILCREYIISWL